VYRPSSRVDYTERRKTERKNVFQLHHRPTTERRNIKRKKNETVIKFLVVHTTPTPSNLLKHAQALPGGGGSSLGVRFGLAYSSNGL